MSLYRRAGSKIWWMDFTHQGQRVRQSTGTEDKAEARQAEARARIEVKQARAAPSRWRLRHLLGQYWEGRAKHAKNHATILYQMEALSEQLGPNSFVADISASTLVTYVEARRIGRVREVAGKQVAQLRSPASINRELELLRAAMNFAADVHGQPVPRIVWTKIKLKEADKRVRYLTLAEYQRLLAAASDDEMRLMVTLACASGLRRENLRGVDWNQIDLLNGRITVVAKGGINREVRLSGEPLETLRRYAAEALRKTKDQKLKGPAFPMPNWRKRWERTRTAAGIANYRWHDHRHTFASWARMAGVDIADIADAMFHSSIQMTTRYAHITPEHASTAWSRVATNSPLSTVTAQSTSQSEDDKPLSD
jgi:integrase